MWLHRLVGYKDIIRSGDIWQCNFKKMLKTFSEKYVRLFRKHMPYKTIFSVISIKKYVVLDTKGIIVS